ncbi:Scr1 family TA system antitoxin-like transcriptional regulator [Actinomadura terrae]|uniref:Scr1 family TA system antitoxin-like transcriptional regulator n=1 Tax=Actinomadura terrae TaxID=604353 RepID=UPI003557140B
MRRQIYVQSTSQARVSEYLDVSRSHVTRLVNGTRRLSPEHATALDAYWQLRGLLAHLVAHALARPDDDWMTSLAAYEARATRVRSWDMGAVPGLWQTPDYARTMFERGHAAGLLSDVDAALATRLERQAAVWGRADPPRVSAFISWVALSSPPGRDPQVMRDQLAYLLELSERPGASVRVVGQHMGWHIGHDGSCKLLTVGADMAFAEAAGTVGKLILDPDRVEHYARRMEQISDLAWNAEESRTAIQQAMRTYA